VRRRSGAFSNSGAIPRAAAGVVPVYMLYIYIIYNIHVPHDHTAHSRAQQYNTRAAVVVRSRWRAGGRYTEDVFNWLLFQKNYEFSPRRPSSLYSPPSPSSLSHRLSLCCILLLLLLLILFCYCNYSHSRRRWPVVAVAYNCGEWAREGTCLPWHFCKG